MDQQRIWATLDPFLEAGPVLGRTQANSGFLRALLARDPYDAYHFFLASRAACQELRQQLQENWPDLFAQGKFLTAIRQGLPQTLATRDYAVFHLSDCIVSPAFLASLRNAYARKIFPITSVTHSLSYARYGLEFLKHLHPGNTARDVVVATSRTAAEVVRGYYASLRRNYGLDAGAFPAPGVAIIPLGVDMEEFNPPASSLKNQAKLAWGFGEETVFLVLARLCYSSKMDFLPILRAFQRLFLDGLPRQSVRLVLSGWTDEADWGQHTLADLAANIGLPLTIAPCPSDTVRQELYAAADVFLSPSDNLQETFGLTLLEAQAMGLPVIASDFDGYRDLVEPDVTGLLVPTIGPETTAALDFLAPLSFDNHTHLLLAQRLAVDIPALAVAISRLAGDAQERRRMGQAAAIRAQGFSWASVVERYLALWQQLETTDVPVRPPASIHPAAVQYGQVFGCYPSAVLGSEMTVCITRLGQAIYREQDFPLIYEGLSGELRPEALRTLLVLARKPVAFGELAAKLTVVHEDLDDEAAQTHVLWCLKHDLLERSVA